LPEDERAEAPDALADGGGAFIANAVSEGLLASISGNTMDQFFDQIRTPADDMPRLNRVDKEILRTYLNSRARCQTDTASSFPLAKSARGTPRSQISTERRNNLK
jgi:hypothetical protein